MTVPNLFDPPMPTEPPTGAKPGHWEQNQRQTYRDDPATGTAAVAVTWDWIEDPPTPPDAKQRRTARDLVTALRSEIVGLDTTIAAFKALASPTVAQHRRFSVDVAEAQSRIVKLQGRIQLRLLDAGDGLSTETPLSATALSTGGN